MSTLKLRAERRAATSRPAMAMCSRLDAASIAIPSGAEAGHGQAGGLALPAEGARQEPRRGLQGRSMYSSSEGRHV